MKVLTLAFLCLMAILFDAVTCQKDSDEEDKAYIRFWLYPNASNVDDVHEFKLNDQSTFKNSNFSRNKQVKILIHGASSNCTVKPFPLQPIKAYLQDKLSRNLDYNVICVDWEYLASPNSIKRKETVEEAITRNTMLTGTQTGLLLKLLKKNALISNYNDVHLIGHSLGAHTSGIAGLTVRQNTDFKEILGRITGIDPAGIFYRSRERNLDEQLDLSDATFVDIIHTNDKQVGLEGKYGHADFYPDGGQHQRECYRRGYVTAIAETFIGGCSHVIGPEYWAASILYKNITACKAKSYDDFKKSSTCNGGNEVYFGDNAPTNLFGQYYLDYNA